MLRSKGLYIGLMSGTSLDSIDAALVDLTMDKVLLVDQLEYPLPARLRQQLIELCQPGSNEIERMGVADRALGKEFAKAALALLKQSGKSPADIVAIGSHGQTIRHRPDIDNSFTLQIADPNTIAFETGITTIADFRRRDISAGGQGAPLAPAFHQAAFHSTQHNRAIINIGGMANITLLTSNQATLGFDTGPGNILMDGWIQKHQQQYCDKDGLWAASGNTNTPLLNKLLDHPYFEKKQPKSTGREDFNIEWLHSITNNLNLSAKDVQATLLELTARSITHEVNKSAEEIDQIFICGGGAYNKQLMARLETLLSPRPVSNTSALGIPAEWVEATAFAWLAQQTIEGKTGNLTSVTGAIEKVILGAIYQA